MPVMAALKAVTSTAARQIFQDDNRGSITPGKFVDLVELSGNPLDDPVGIKDLHVLLTMVGGRTIFQAEP